MMTLQHSMVAIDEIDRYPETIPRRRNIVSRPGGGWTNPQPAGAEQISFSLDYDLRPKSFGEILVSAYTGSQEGLTKYADQMRQLRIRDRSGERVAKYGMPNVR